MGGAKRKSPLESLTFSPLRDTISRGPYMNLALRVWSWPSNVTRSLARWLEFRFWRENEKQDKITVRRRRPWLVLPRFGHRLERNNSKLERRMANSWGCLHRTVKRLRAMKCVIFHLNRRVIMWNLRNTGHESHILTVSVCCNWESEKFCSATAHRYTIKMFFSSLTFYWHDFPVLHLPFPWWCLLHYLRRFYLFRPWENSLSHAI